jgi:hypothetical protein
VVMLACSMWALSSWRHMSGGSTGRPGAARDRRSRPQPSSSGRSRFMERLEERWRRRQERDR